MEQEGSGESTEHPSAAARARCVAASQHHNPTVRHLTYCSAYVLAYVRTDVKHLQPRAALLRGETRGAGGAAACCWPDLTAARQPDQGRLGRGGTC